MNEFFTALAELREILIKNRNNVRPFIEDRIKELKEEIKKLIPTEDFIGHIVLNGDGKIRATLTGLITGLEIDAKNNLISLTLFEGNGKHDIKEPITKIQMFFYRTIKDDDFTFVIADDRLVIESTRLN